LQAAGTVDDQGADSESRPGAIEAPGRRFIPFALAAVVITCTYWTVDIISPALPEIKSDLALSAKGAGLVFSLLFLGRLIGNFPAAHLPERVGSPHTASIGVLLLAIVSAIAMVAPGVEVLYAGRVVQGIGISLLVNAGLRSILFAKPGRGSAMTLFGIASTIGGVLGLQSGGLLTGREGWRSVFALATLLGVLLSFLPMLGSRVSRRAGPSVTPVAGSPSSVSLRSYLAPVAINFLIFSNYAIWVILPLYAQDKFDIGPETTANLLLVITVVHLAASVPVAGLIRRFGSASVLIGALLVAVAGTVGIVLAPSVWILVFPLVLYGCGMIGAVNSAGDIVLHRGGADSRAVGALRQTSDLGLVIGPVVAGALADRFGYGSPFVVYPVLMICAAAAGMLAPGILKSSQKLEEAQ
jgi:DHA1 family multidrug resistance protein-like MFS transporter